jgi:ribonuclease Z
LSYEVVFHAINPRKREVIWEDRTLTVESIPLKHKVPTCGFLFTERHRDQEPRKRYAYCSDTAYREQIVEQIAGVDVLYHEATYTEKDVDKCKKHTHSTAKQAANIARLAGVGKLVIGHFSAREDNHNVFLEEAKEVFPNTVLAVERTSIEL